MRQKVGIFQDSSAPCTPTSLVRHLKLPSQFYLHSSLPSLLLLYSSSFCISLLAVCFQPTLLFPTLCSSGLLSQIPFLPLSFLFGTQLVPLSEPPLAQTGTRGKETAAPCYQARNSGQKKKKKTQQNSHGADHTFTPVWVAVACQHVQTFACARMRKKRLMSSQAYVSVDWRTLQNKNKQAC